MSLVTSRRNLIIGATSLIACPMIVRAASIMDLRGDLMDKWVIVFGGCSDRGPYLSSQFNHDSGVYQYLNSPKSQVERGYLLAQMSADPRTRVRQLNLIRPYELVHYIAMKQSEVLAANEKFLGKKNESLTLCPVPKNELDRLPG